jgi:hypothetical protein
MDRNSEESTKVVSLFSKRPTQETPKKSTSEMGADELFNSVMQKNEENRKRLAEDRLKANKGVLRSYRIKN